MTPPKFKVAERVIVYPNALISKEHQAKWKGQRGFIIRISKDSSYSYLVKGKRNGETAFFNARELEKSDG